MNVSEPGLPVDFAQRLNANVDNWKRKLLDLSRRNRALNFKPTKVSTIEIVDEQPAEVFRLLYVQETPMRFRAAEPAPVSAPASDSATVVASDSKIAPASDSTGVSEVESEIESEIDEASESEQALEFVPYDAASVDERHKDGWLQTKLVPEALDHALRRIDEQARTALEEQGVNTLFLTLGMLRYRDPRDPDTWFRAPLVFIPVEVARKTARSGYGLSASDDDAFVNPALVEYLRASFGVALPELPDSETIADTYDLQTFFKGVGPAVASQPGWSVQTDTYVGLFSFQKLVMFKDLEAHVDPIGQHRLIRQLLSKTGSPVHGLPADIRGLPLDTMFSPEATHQVVDADSSQMRAAAAVAKGYDIVIEGPPGTGKSQTITNLVAQALAANKSVLFVAEKMAALDVVHRRLSEAGLGEFCLELHSSKANKRAVMKELASALDASLQSVAGRTNAGKRIPEVRAALAGYVEAVHEPFGTLGSSPYNVSGELGRVLQAPKLRLNTDVTTLTQEQLGAAERALRDLTVHASDVGTPTEHPWRDTSRTLYTEDDLDLVDALSGKIGAAVDDLLGRVASIGSAFGLPPAATLDEVAALASFADLLGDSPGVAADVLCSDAWNTPPLDASEILDTLRKAQSLRDRLASRLTSAAFEQTHEADVAYVEQKRSGLFGFLAVLDGRYRAITRRWLTYRNSGDRPPVLDQAADLRLADQLMKHLADLKARDATARTLFGQHWNGDRSDAARLDAYVTYVVRYRRVAIDRGLAAQTADVARRERPDVSGIREAVALAGSLRTALGELRQAVGWPEGYLERRRTLADVGARVRDLAAHLGKAQSWAAFEASRQRAAATIASEAVEAGMAGQLPFDLLCEAFLRAFYMKWLSAAIQARPALHRFDTLSHEGLIAEFRQLDEQVLHQNRASLIGMVRDRAQHKLQQPEAAASLPRLRREMTKQRRLSPLRKTLRECDATIRAIKPCYLMSPLTVAQYLDGRQPTFDLVIFDEASQLPTEDAIGAVIRGRQLVVVGDPKQLPPTNFFAVSSGVVTAPLGDDGSPLYEDSESVLEEFMGAAVPMSRLKWHYRSAHESLISFSNVNFYDADLHTFPSVATNTDSAGIQFHFVEGGVYEGKGVNLIEARRIAGEVVQFAKLQLERQAAGEAPWSLGVGTLNLRQQLAILDELEVRRRDDPSIEPFFTRTGHEPFFVKNLENIQGDERDSIFLSITYGKSPDGRVRYNFGPLNRENGWRRLNVLVTRARRQMKVFSSIRDHDINPAGAVSDGPRLLREFLAYAEHRRLGKSAAVAAGDAESPFERDVHLELTRRGLRVEQQIGICGYRVDLGVLDDEVPGRFVCGIECDGVAYHAMETVRDRDRLRQQVLEARGWTIHRVWSTDWFKDRQGQIERLLRLVDESRIRVRADAAEAKKEQAQAQAQAQAEARAQPQTQGQAVPLPASMTARAAEPVPVSSRPGYERPVAPPYEIYRHRGTQPTTDILETPLNALAEMIERIVEVEGPLHEADVMARVAGLWSTKAGSRIQAAIRKAAADAISRKKIDGRGAFLWRNDAACRVRSRLNTGISGDRIAPEEIAAAVQLVLAAGYPFQRQALITETRAVLGYSRTGPILEETIGSALDDLLSRGTLGEASEGIVLRAGRLSETDPVPAE